MRKLILIAAILLRMCLPNLAFAESATDGPFDVVVYGGTAAGIMAAVQVRQMNRSVVVIEPTNRIGGLTTGGLGQTDIGNKAAVGGLSRDFYRGIRQYYQDPAHWRWQQPHEYRSGGQSRTDPREDTMWTFEPSAALSVLQSFVTRHNIPVVYSERLDRDNGVTIKDRRIVSIRMESGRIFRGRMFIDAGYEGDLMAAAGISYTVGRESNQQYGETLNGVQTQRAIHHQLVQGVDPYVEKGNPASGLLPGIDATGPGEEGSGDHRVQAYCFRMCLTDHPDNRLPFRKPEGYDERDYELLFRNFEAGFSKVPWSNSPMPNRKTDINNNYGVSTDFIGRNYDYPDASYQRRAEIVQNHRRYQQGLMWTLANHPRVPEHVRKEVSRWGTCRDEFESPDGWQQQLYIREARRMTGDYVMTQHNCVGSVAAERPVGLAAYTMDSHHVQRYIDQNGFAKNEGDVQVGGFSPYPIDMGALLPKQSECGNLVVPVCLSATHIAFGSIRMEPVFMVLGQSAATIAVHAIEEDTVVHQIDYGKLKERLLRDKQVLQWTGPVRSPTIGLAPEKFPGIVIDDQHAIRKGFDTVSTSVGPYIGVGYRHDSDAGKGLQSAVFRAEIEQAGKYRILIAYTAHSNRASRVPVRIRTTDSSQVVYVNQKKKPSAPPFEPVADLQLAEGTVEVEISNTDTDGYVIIDAVQIVPVAAEDSN